MVELSPFGERVRDIANDPRCNSYLGCFAAAVDPEEESSSKTPKSEPKVIEPRPGGQFPGEFIGPVMMPPALMEVINDPRITITEEMIPIINDEDIVVTRNGQPAKKMSGRDIIRRSGQFSRQNLVPNFATKKKRKVSKYQKEFGKQLKKLKVKHPRTKITQLMKRAHRATRKVMK